MMKSPRRMPPGNDPASDQDSDAASQYHGGIVESSEDAIISKNLDGIVTRSSSTTAPHLGAAGRGSPAAFLFTLKPAPAE